jgi:hypothetical protein
VIEAALAEPRHATPTKRTTPPPRAFPDAGYVVAPVRAIELDAIADWIVREVP